MPENKSKVKSVKQDREDEEEEEEEEEQAEGIITEKQEWAMKKELDHIHLTVHFDIPIDFVESSEFLSACTEAEYLEKHGTKRKHVDNGKMKQGESEDGSQNENENENENENKNANKKRRTIGVSLQKSFSPSAFAFVMTDLVFYDDTHIFLLGKDTNVYDLYTATVYFGRRQKELDTWITRLIETFRTNYNASHDHDSKYNPSKFKSLPSTVLYDILMIGSVNSKLFEKEELFVRAPMPLVFSCMSRLQKEPHNHDLYFSVLPLIKEYWMDFIESIQQHSNPKKTSKPVFGLSAARKKGGFAMVDFKNNRDYCSHMAERHRAKYAHLGVSTTYMLARNFTDLFMLDVFAFRSRLSHSDCVENQEEFIQRFHLLSHGLFETYVQKTENEAQESNQSLVRWNVLAKQLQATETNQTNEPGRMNQMIEKTKVNQTNETIKAFPWNSKYMIVAGGSVLAALHKQDLSAHCDFDIFLLGSKKQQNEIAMNCLQFWNTCFLSSSSDSKNGMYAGIMNGHLEKIDYMDEGTKPSTFRPSLMQVGFLDSSASVQLLHMTEQFNAFDAIDDFDLSYCSFLYDGTNVFGTSEALKSLQTRIAEPNPKVPSTRTSRLYKAFKKGFSIEGHSRQEEFDEAPQAVKDAVDETYFYPSSNNTEARNRRLFQQMYNLDFCTNDPMSEDRVTNWLL